MRYLWTCLRVSSDAPLRDISALKANFEEFTVEIMEGMELVGEASDLRVDLSSSRSSTIQVTLHARQNLSV